MSQTKRSSGLEKGDKLNDGEWGAQMHTKDGIFDGTNERHESDNDQLFKFYSTFQVRTEKFH